jgi:hypothetical protein
MSYSSSGFGAICLIMTLMTQNSGKQTASSRKEKLKKEKVDDS